MSNNKSTAAKSTAAKSTAAKSTEGDKPVTLWAWDVFQKEAIKHAATLEKAALTAAVLKEQWQARILGKTEEEIKRMGDELREAMKAAGIKPSTVSMALRKIGIEGRAGFHRKDRIEIEETLIQWIVDEVAKRLPAEHVSVAISRARDLALKTKEARIAEEKEKGKK